jgi:hypothetical protein
VIRRLASSSVGSQFTPARDRLYRPRFAIPARGARPLSISLFVKNRVVDRFDALLDFDNLSHRFRNLLVVGRAACDLSDIGSTLLYELRASLLQISYGIRRHEAEFNGRVGREAVDAASQPHGLARSGHALAAKIASMGDHF